MKHHLRHIGIVVVGLVVLPPFGVPWPTALYIGLMAGCVLMAFGGGHGAHTSDGGATDASQKTESHRH
jgi:hypothetical protein